ncbi:MAG TPA: PASTA domain-containing protein, partial [Solirubrobacteraceae bacterium]|nr:PASTA domain-containing protein [Solirubrobacteraceae bacterium]
KQLSFSDTAKPGALFGTDPPGGTKVAAGSAVKLLVSAGFPQIAYDDGKNVLLVNGADGKRLETIAKSPKIEKEPSFNLTGSALAFVSASKPPPGSLDSPDGALMLSNRAKPDEAPVALTPDGEKWRVPAFAPTEGNVLAAIRFGGEGKRDGDLCIGEVDGGGYAVDCIADPKISIKRVVRWAPDGKALYAFGDTARHFGIVRYTTDRPFSPDTDDYGDGEFVTDLSQGADNKGVIDLAISPDGKTMAVVANFESDAFQLYLAKPGDFELTKAKLLPVRACKVSWRPDSLEVAVVQADDCQAGVGDLVRVDRRDPKRLTTLRLGADSPAYQPVLPERRK